MERMERIDSDANISYNPLTIENKHFKVMVEAK